MPSRRVVLQTIGAGCLASACGGGGGGAAEGVAMMCGADLCISIAANAELAEVGGGLLFLQAQGHKIYVVRTASGFVSLTAICTHAFCTIEWDGASAFDCGCHGSRFANDGSVLGGPATRALKIYPNTLVGDTLTITLT
jgi:nitrite reductase/ring-hydroxylating ferredoxin subunit